MSTPGDPSDRSDSSAPHDYLHEITHHAALPETRLSAALDKLIVRIGSWISWFWVVLLGVICVNVFMKNVLGQGSVRFEEIQWHIYSALFLIGLSYTMAYDDHVRVDLLHERFSLKTKAWVDLLGIVLFLLPFIGVLLYFAWPFVLKAYSDGERSNSPAGLSDYWIIKSVLLVGLGLLALSAIARAHRCLVYLLRGSRAASAGGEG